MRELTALIADVVTIVGVLALVAFLLNHPVTRRLGVWAGALRDPYGYGWKRRQRGCLRRRWRVAVDRLLSPLSRIGSQTRQPMKPDAGPTIPRERFDKMQQRLTERAAEIDESRMEDQYRMEEAGARIARRRWWREHRRSQCELCKTPSRVNLLLCMEDCSWNERHPKHLRHRCTDCWSSETSGELGQDESDEPG